MTIRHLTWASLGTGLIAAVWTVSSLSDPAYYDPQTVSDYMASALVEILFLAFAVTLIIWWRVTPLSRGVLMLPGAALALCFGVLGMCWRRSWESNSVRTSSSSEPSLRSCLSR
jgi:hypothetical protein